MADLVVVEDEKSHKALEVRLALFNLQNQYLIETGVAVVAIKHASGDVELPQPVNLTAVGVAAGTATA